MAEIFYGIRRLLLLNSANYAMGDLPLDRPLSISAPNNRGKSTAINALQFPFLGHLNEMAFPRSNEDTLRYYFPYDNSYIVAEIVTETGVFMVGACGKGPVAGYDYQLFAYRAPLDIEDFLEGENSRQRAIRNLKALTTHLASRNVWLKPLTRSQMRSALMGKTVTLNANETFSIGVFRLRNMTDTNYHLFIRIFKNLLHMNNVNLEEMKRLLIDVLLPGGADDSADFMKRYRVLNEEVERTRNERDAIASIAGDVQNLSGEWKKLNIQYGILRILYPRINDRYEEERNGRQEKLNKLEKKLSGFESRKQDLLSSKNEIQQSLAKLNEEKGGAETVLSRIRDGEARFALYESPDVLQNQIDGLQKKRDRLAAELSRNHPENVGGLENDVLETRNHIQKIKNRIASLDDNLLLMLTERLGEPQLKIVSKLLNPDLLTSLSIKEEEIVLLDEESLIRELNSLIERCRNGYFDDGRIRVRLDSLVALDLEEYFDFDKLSTRLKQLDKRLSGLQRDLDVARGYQEIDEDRQSLEHQLKAKRDELSAYEQHLLTAKEKPVLEERLKQTRDQIEERKQSLESADKELSNMSKQESQMRHQIEQKARDLEDLEGKYRRITPISSDEPEGVPPGHRLPDTLEDMIDTYLLSWQNRNESRERINNLMKLVEAKGASRFLRDQDVEEKIQSLMERVDNQEQLETRLRNAQKTMSIELGQLLEQLVNRFHDFKMETRRFNREINQRKISNIRRIEFIIDCQNEILENIQQIVEQDELFSDPVKVHKAVERLDNLISSKGVKLSLENLFNLGIEVELENGEITKNFSTADIQSTGTGLTVKVIMNVMLLNRLMVIRKGQVINIPVYIDEAGQIDADNQETLIRQCLPAGFVPIFASVEPQPTAYYWIPLYESDGRIFVDSNSWVRLHHEDAPVTEAANA